MTRVIGFPLPKKLVSRFGKVGGREEADGRSWDVCVQKIVGRGFVVAVGLGEDILLKK